MFPERTSGVVTGMSPRVCVKRDPPLRPREPAPSQPSQLGEAAAPCGDRCGRARGHPGTGSQCSFFPAPQRVSDRVCLARGPGDLKASRISKLLCRES